MTDSDLNTIPVVSPAVPAISCIGHITHDRIITPRFSADMPGGTAYYFGKALRNLEHDDFRLITSVGRDGIEAVEELKNEGIDIKVIPSERSVFFENAYGEDMNERKQRVLAKAQPFTVESLAEEKAGIFHLGTLLADDFDLSVIKDLSKRGKVSVDIQGYLRKVEAEKVVPVDYDLKREAMPYISVLKANEHEMKTLTGSNDPEEAARILAEWGCREVVLTFGDKGSLIYADGEFHHIPAFPVSEAIDATGCGDTYMAGYLYRRAHGAGYEEAGRFASAMCSLKLAQKGPFSGTKEEIERLMEQNAR